MKFLSVCSGIEAASVAWHPLGWEAVGFSDIDPFSVAFLAHRFPDVRNFGDMTRYADWKPEPFDLLCGGTPCQAFSLAGLRAGLAEPRGNLTLVFLGLVRRWRPRWVFWENVFGVLSDATNAFGTFLAGLGELGYGWSYRVLDAQYFGVPQRRRRVFVVGHLGDWRRSAAVLFEPEGVLGNHPPRGKTGEGVTGTISARTSAGGGLGTDFEIGGGLTTARMRGFGDYALDGTASTLKRRDDRDATDLVIQQVAHTLRGDGLDASKNGTGSDTPLAAFYGEQAGNTALGMSLPGVPPARTKRGCGIAVAFAGRDSGVRRLTPRECERLQGFPDDWTLIPYRSKPAADAPRYRAIGNSWAVPVVRWIGRRIAFVDGLGAKP